MKTKFLRQTFKTKLIYGTLFVIDIYYLCLNQLMYPYGAASVKERKSFSLCTVNMTASRNVNMKLATLLFLGKQWLGATQKILKLLNYITCLLRKQSLVEHNEDIINISDVLIVFLLWMMSSNEYYLVKY